MMAKMFYSMDETRTALGKDEEEIKQLAREGRLREFRDGARLMFKADQVEQLKAELSGEAPRLDQVDLGPSDSGSPIGLAESKGASGTSITLSEVDTGPGGKDDTGLAADLGLSGSIGGSMGGAGESRAGRSGSVINVFGADEVEQADPMAQTAITPNLQDQLNLEGVGSGSGLLDLTRESDDTSLGADIWEEVAPADRGGESAGLPGIEEPRGGVIRGAVIPTYVEAYDSSATAFGAAALATALVVLFGGFVLMAAVSGARIAFITDLGARGLWFLAGIGAAAAVVFFIVGLLVGRSGR